MLDLPLQIKIIEKVSPPNSIDKPLVSTAAVCIFEMKQENKTHNRVTTV